MLVSPLASKVLRVLTGAFFCVTPLKVSSLLSGVFFLNCNSALLQQNQLFICIIRKLVLSLQRNLKILNVLIIISCD